MLSQRVVIILALTLAIFLLSWWSRKPTDGLLHSLAVLALYLLTGGLVAILLFPSLFRTTDLAKSPPRAVVEWIRVNRIPLAARTDLGRSESLPLVAALGERRIILAGESSHLAGDFGRVKTELLRQLVDREILDVLVLEAPTVACLRAEEALRTGGSPERALEALPPLLRNPGLREALELIQSSLASSQPIRLFGCDIQFYGTDHEHALEYLVRSFRDLDPAFSARLAAELPRFLEDLGPGQTVAPRPVASEVGLNALCLRAGEILDAAERSDPFATLTQRIILGNLVQLRRMLDSDYVEGYLVRERGMAENLRMLDEWQVGPGLLFVWAHSDHVSRSTESRRLIYPALTESAKRMVGTWRLESMGALLCRYLPGAVYSIGIFGADGRLGGCGNEPYPIEDPRPDSLEGLVPAPNAYATALLLAEGSSGPEPRPVLVLAQLRNGLTWYRSPLNEEYDAVLVVAVVSPLDEH